MPVRILTVRVDRGRIIEREYLVTIFLALWF